MRMLWSPFSHLNVVLPRAAPLDIDIEKFLAVLKTRLSGAFYDRCILERQSSNTPVPLRVYGRGAKLYLPRP